MKLAGIMITNKLYYIHGISSIDVRRWPRPSLSETMKWLERSCQDCRRSLPQSRQHHAWAWHLANRKGRRKREGEKMWAKKKITRRDKFTSTSVFWWWFHWRRWDEDRDSLQVERKGITTQEIKKNQQPTIIFIKGFRDDDLRIIPSICIKGTKSLERSRDVMNPCPAR